MASVFGSCTFGLGEKYHGFASTCFVDDFYHAGRFVSQALKGSLGTASPHLFRPEYKVGSSGGGGEGETQAVLCG